MRVDEAFRRMVGGYWWLIGLFVLLPSVGAGVYGAHQPTQYAAVARIQMSGGLASTNVQADAATQWLQGVITTPSMVKDAMAAAGIPGDPTLFATNSITVTRVGVSTVNDISVVTTNPDRSVIAANSLVQQALSYANTSHQGDAAQMTALNNQIDGLTKNRDKLIAQLAVAPPGLVLELQARIAAVAPTLTDLLRQRSDLTLASSQRSSIGLLDPASPLPSSVGPRVRQLVALAGLAGLLVGIGLAAILEAVRPRVRGRRWVAAELGAPLLGHLPTTALDSPHGASALREFGRAADVVDRRFADATVVLLPVDRRHERWAARVATDLESLTGLRIEHSADAVRAPVSADGTRRGDAGTVVIALSPSIEAQRNLNDLSGYAETMGWPIVGVLTFRRPWLFGRRDPAKRSQNAAPFLSEQPAPAPVPIPRAAAMINGAVAKPKTRMMK